MNVPRDYHTEYETKDKHPKILLTGGSQKLMQVK